MTIPPERRQPRVGIYERLEVIEAQNAALRAQNAELKELLVPARDMIIGFSFGKQLAADIDAALAAAGQGSGE